MQKIMTIFHTRNLLLRPWSQENIPSLIQHANNRKIWINVKDRFPHPYTEEAGRFWVEIANQDPLQHNFAMIHGGQAIGGIGLHCKEDIFQKTADIGYWLGEPYWGKGFATEAIEKITAWGFETLGLRRIQAGVFEWNPASMRVLEKAGYQLEAKLEKNIWKDEKLIDEFLYVKFKQDI